MCLAPLRATFVGNQKKDRPFGTAFHAIKYIFLLQNEVDRCTLLHIAFELNFIFLSAGFYH